MFYTKAKNKMTNQLLKLSSYCQHQKMKEIKNGKSLNQLLKTESVTSLINNHRQYQKTKKREKAEPITQDSVSHQFKSLQLAVCMSEHFLIQHSPYCHQHHCHCHHYHQHYHCHHHHHIHDT